MSVGDILHNMGIKAVGAYLRVLREQQNLSQKHIALKLMVSEKQVSRWEKGTSNPAGVMLIHFASLVGGNLDDISSLLLSPTDIPDDGEISAKKRIEGVSLTETPESSEKYLLQAIEHALLLRRNKSSLEKLVNFGKKLVGE